MKKKHSIGRFVVITCICALLLALTIFSFALPGAHQDYDYVGFAKAINLGIEYQGGTAYEYKIKSNSTNNNGIGVEHNKIRLEKLLGDNYYDANIYQNGDNIVVELMDEFSPVAITEIVNIKPYFAIKTEKSDTAEAFIDSSHVDTAYGVVSGGQVGFVMTFNAEGQAKAAQLTDNIYLYFGDLEPSTLQITETLTTTLAFTLPNGNKSTVDYYASEVMASKYNLSYEEVGVKTYSKEDAKRNVITAICLAVGLFAVCVTVLTLVFKKLGLVGALIMFISVLLQIILLQAVPIFVLTGPSLFASLLCMILGTMYVYLIFNKMHAEYKMGKILYASVKFGYEKIWKSILDINLVLLFTSIITYFFGSYLVKQFAMAMICGIVVYAVCTLLFTKFFSRWFTNISFKNKDYGFSREANVNELK